MPKWVLVVDDEPEVTYALQAYLLGKGYEMLTALDGIQAMRHLRQHTIDLVILDMKMPGVNGVEVLQFIHAQTPSTKVVVVTAYDAQFQKSVERLGVDGFLIKPFGIEALTSTLEEVLSGRPTLPSAPPKEPLVSPGWPLPKARLLFVEPSEYTYKLKEVFFTSPQDCGGIFEVAAAYSEEEALEKLASFKPDILLADLAMLGPTGDLAVKAMGSRYHPHELILYGSGSALASVQGAQVKDLSERGVKVIFNESSTRAGLLRLSEVIRKTALAHGLTEAKK